MIKNPNFITFHNMLLRRKNQDLIIYTVSLDFGVQHERNYIQTSEIEVRKRESMIHRCHIYAKSKEASTRGIYATKSDIYQYKI
jgi:hypothetical protein